LRIFGVELFGLEELIFENPRRSGGLLVVEISGVLVFCENRRGEVCFCNLESVLVFSVWRFWNFCILKRARF